MSSQQVWRTDLYKLITFDQIQKKASTAPLVKVGFSGAGMLITPHGTVAFEKSHHSAQITRLGRAQ
jgi:hypothetical protein